MPTYNVIPLSSNPQGQVVVSLGDTVAILITRYNYSAACWTLDIQDSNGNNILTGIMLIPGADLLAAYPENKKALGSLVLAEKNAGDYQNPEGLGTLTKLIWFAYGEDITFP